MIAKRIPAGAPRPATVLTSISAGVGGVLIIRVWRRDDHGLELVDALSDGQEDDVTMFRWMHQANESGMLELFAEEV